MIHSFLSAKNLNDIIHYKYETKEPQVLVVEMM